MKRKLLKKKTKKGFTLIELLAVILILGIIALIAVPTVNGVIEEARKGANKSSASQYIKSINEAIIMKNISGIEFENKLYTVDEINDIGIEIKGDVPSSGYVLIDDEVVVSCNLLYDNYSVKCEDDDYNVSNLSKEPLIQDVSNTELNVGDKICISDECFYVLSETEDSIRMLSEWNLNVGYSITYNGSDEFKAYNVTASSYVPSEQFYLITGYDYIKITPKNYQIKQDKNVKGKTYNSTSKKYKLNGTINFLTVNQEQEDSGTYYSYWTNSNKSTLKEYNKGSGWPFYVYDSNSNLYKYINAYVDNLKILLNSNEVTGDLISFEELLNLGCTSYYTDSATSCASAPSWFTTTSFWTGSAGGVSSVWAVYETKYGNSGIKYASEAGVRPVITIPKSVL